MKSLQGQLLVASPHLLDPNFARTVVLIVRHNDEGAFGLVLNRPTTTPMKQVWPQVSEMPCHTEEFLHLGGPVNGPLLAIHTQESLAQVEILPGLYLSGGPDQLAELVAAPGLRVRFFVGNAGWGPGQLDSESEVGAWFTSPATVDQVFDQEDDLWERVIKQVASSTALAALKIKHIPNDPTLN